MAEDPLGIFGPPTKNSSGTFIAGIVVVALVLFAGVYFLQTEAKPEPKPSLKANWTYIPQVEDAIWREFTV